MEMVVWLLVELDAASGSVDGGELELLLELVLALVLVLELEPVLLLLLLEPVLLLLLELELELELLVVSAASSSAGSADGGAPVWLSACISTTPLKVELVRPPIMLASSATSYTSTASVMALLAESTASPVTAVAGVL